MKNIKSIYFPQPMADNSVCAILDGRKKMMRLVVKPQPKYSIVPDHKDRKPLAWWVDNERWVKPPHQPGQTLYVRETWAKISWNNQYVYKADYIGSFGWGWSPSIQMPHEAARIFLRVTDVRVERLHCMTEEDAVAEGFEAIKCDHPGGYPCTDCMNTGYLEPAMLGFVETWNSTIKPKDRALYGWEANPFVWVIEFERISEREALL